MFCSLALGLLSSLLTHPHLVATTPLPAPQTGDLPLGPAESVTPLYQFPNGSWIENISIRSNGNLLLTRFDVPQLWEVSPFSPSTSAKLLLTIPDAVGLTGIAEIAPDVFAVSAGGTRNPFGTPGSWSIWKVTIDTNDNAVGTKITALPEAGHLNGMALLIPGNDGAILVDDQVNGLVYRVNMGNGDNSIVIQDPAMLANVPPSVPPLGINGIKVRSDHLWFTNTLQNTVCKIPIDPLTGSVTGPVKVITNNLLGPDDFTLDTAGRPYVASFSTNQLEAVKPNGDLVVIATGLVGPTSAAFGRTADDSTTIYVTTSGTMVVGFHVVLVEGARVVAVKLE